MGASAPTPAAPGTYVDTEGATVAKRAPIGTYVSSTGATAPTPAELGRYVDTVGATVAKLAAPGTYVGVTGASAVSIAQPGTYVDSFGASAATLASPGYYVALAGATAQTIAPAGTYVPYAGASSFIVAPLGSIILNGGPGDDQLSAAAPAKKQIPPANIILGYAGNDTVTGGGGDDTLYGGVGNDRLQGEAGNDLILGDDGTDSLFGGAGDDTLIGGLGADRLDGGKGRNVYRYIANSAEWGDTIISYSLKDDQIEVSASAFGGGLQAGAPAPFVANASGLATSPAGVGQFIWQASSLRLWFDADGAGGANPVLLAQFVGLTGGAANFTASEITVIT